MKNTKRVLTIVGLVIIVALVTFVIIKKPFEEKKEIVIETTTTVEELEINTPYGNLYYPAKWEKNLKIKKNDKKTYKVHFFAKMNKQEYPLFDISFGKEREYTLGYVTDGNKKVAVNVKSYNVEVNEDMTDKERDILLGMSEDINYVIEKIESMDSFTIE